MTDMIERVARAIAESDSGPMDSALFAIHWHEFGESYIDCARAAIAAMRDCTPEMLDAGSAAHPAGGYRRETLLNDIIEAEWRAMCDAALKCSTKRERRHGKISAGTEKA